MLFDGGGKPLPVVYYDGEREFNLGILMVDPTMNFYSILSILSQKIGISPHQFSVFIADKSSDRKIPFNAKLNLATVSRDGGADYIFVKRSRRSKKSPAQKKNLSEKLMHLRRDGAVDGTQFNGFMTASVVAPSLLKRAEIERRMLNLCMEREAAFSTSMGETVEYLRRGTPMGNGGGTGSGYDVCKECLMAKAAETGSDFHLCFRDEVVVGFRTTAGPISRPAKSSGKVGSGENGH